MSNIRVSMSKKEFRLMRLQLKKLTKFCRIFFSVICTDGFQLSLHVCEPGLYHIYRRLGFRPLAKIHNSVFGGYRIPLYIVATDYEYLKRINSPFYNLAKKQHFPKDEIAAQWFEDFKKNEQFIAPGFAFVEEEEQTPDFEAQLFNGMTEKGIQELLTRAIHLHCGQGDVVIAKNSGDRNVGFIIKGALEARNQEKVNVLLAQGDMFGEVSCVADIAHVNDLVAASPETEIVILSQSAFKRLSLADDKISVWKNLAKVIAHRLIAKNDY